MNTESIMWKAEVLDGVWKPCEIAVDSRCSMNTVDILSQAVTFKYCSNYNICFTIRSAHSVYCRYGASVNEVEQ